MQPFRGSVEMMPGWIEGVLQHGHGVASGANSESPYPKGSISIQSPFFKALGLDLSCYWHGTINLSFKPLEIILRNPDISFENMYFSKEMSGFLKIISRGLKLRLIVPCQ